MKTISCLLFLTFLCDGLPAQEVIHLVNPSFEGIPKAGTLIAGWRNCATAYETPPDLHPIPHCPFGVTQKPQDGVSFLGMVTRDQGTTESVGHLLESPLLAKQTYSMSIQLCRPENFVSASRFTLQLETFTRPVVLRIWGGTSPCDQKEVLAVSPPVNSTKWEKHIFIFAPTENISHLVLEAFYVHGVTKNYNGCLFLDNASAIVPISFETEDHPASSKSASVSENHYEIVGFPIKPFNNYTPKHLAIDFLALRLVNGKDEINGLILDHCHQAGFLKDSRNFTEEIGLGIKEVAYNVKKHKHLRLLVGLPPGKDPLIAERKTKLERTFKAVRLKKKQYQIIVLPTDWHDPTWLCGQNELWLKVAELDKKGTGRQ